VQGYRILGHRLEFLGICPQCKNTHTSQHSEKE
jgi:Fe2+ or Zn2+ uptake regulation protein